MKRCVSSRRSRASSFEVKRGKTMTLDTTRSNSKAEAQARWAAALQGPRIRTHAKTTNRSAGQAAPVHQIYHTDRQDSGTVQTTTTRKKGTKFHTTGRSDAATRFPRYLGITPDQHRKSLKWALAERRQHGSIPRATCEQACRHPAQVPRCPRHAATGTSPQCAKCRSGLQESQHNSVKTRCASASKKSALDDRHRNKTWGR